MKYPTLNNISQSREMTTYFNGYSHLLSCSEGSFYDEKNMTTEYYPILSPRAGRGKIKTYTKLQGILDKEDLITVDNGILYVNDEATDVIVSNETDKAMCKMGAYVVIFPDKVWYNAETKEHGDMGNSVSKNASVSFTLCGSDGSAITWHDADYYSSNTPKEGDYMMSTSNGKTSLRVYSSATGIWSSVATTYMKIATTGIGAGFKKEDGVKITLDLTSASWDYGKQNIFVNEGDDNTCYSNFVIYDVGDDYITIPALLNENKALTLPITVAREVPDIAFLTECQNRLWGCSTDGHEIYCCKLGDVTNWNCFAGIATDSWAATVGTDGKFTGAYSYLGYPIFFKEDSLIRVTISSTGAHQTKDVKCRGVQSGSEKSLVMLNELLYYKATDGICVYDGSFPSSISDALGQVRYKNAVGGSIDNRYYIAMQDESDNHHVFVFDKNNNIWSREDDANISFFCNNKGNLYFVSENALYSIKGDTEGQVKWMVESGNIGYSLADKKYVSRFNIRMFLENLSHVSMYISYDDGEWEFLFNMSGKGTKTFTIPVIPRRCDHFRYKLVGVGEAKLYSITKTIEEGSDM